MSSGECPVARSRSSRAMTQVEQVLRKVTLFRADFSSKPSGSPKLIDRNVADLEKSVYIFLLDLTLSR